MTIFFLFFCEKPIAIEIGPTRPKYMVMMIITFPAIVKFGVNPLVKPTVASADTHS